MFAESNPKESNILLNYLKMMNQRDTSNINERKHLFHNILNLNVLLTKNEKDGTHLIKILNRLFHRKKNILKKKILNLTLITKTPLLKKKENTMKENMMKENMEEVEDMAGLNSLKSHLPIRV